MVYFQPAEEKNIQYWHNIVQYLISMNGFPHVKSLCRVVALGAWMWVPIHSGPILQVNLRSGGPIPPLAYPWTHPLDRTPLNPDTYSTVCKTICRQAKMTSAHRNSSWSSTSLVAIFNYDMPQMYFGNHVRYFCGNHIRLFYAKIMVDSSVEIMFYYKLFTHKYFYHLMYSICNIFLEDTQTLYYMFTRATWANIF